MRPSFMHNTWSDIELTTLTQYRADYSKVFGLIMNKMAVGTVQLMDLAIDRDYEPRRQGTFMVAKMAVGHGILRADCAIELASL